MIQVIKGQNEIYENINENIKKDDNFSTIRRKKPNNLRI